MKRLLIIDEFNSLNDGEMARVICLVQSLRRLRSDTDFSILSSSVEVDQNRYTNYNINVVSRPWFRKTDSRLASSLYFGACALIFLFSCALLRSFKIRRGLRKYDAFIHLTGDVLNDRGLTVLLYHMFHILLGIVSNIPVLICAESIGPFQNRLAGVLAQVLLNRVKLITVRDQISKSRLQIMNINKPIVHLTADPAFLLEPKPSAAMMKKAMNDNSPIIGVSPAQGMSPYFSHDFGITMQEKYQTYVKLMAKMVNYLLENLNATVVLIPHVTRDDGDDRLVNEDIFREIRDKDRTRLITESHTPDEIKQIISQCDMLVGSRMHAAIASLSLAIPTIAIGHSDKFYGVIGKMLDQGETVIDIRNLNFAQLDSKTMRAIDYVWTNRDLIRRNLRQKMSEIRELALLNAKFISDFVVGYTE